MLRPTRFEASRRRWTGLLLTTIWRDEFRRSNNFVASVSKWTRRVSNNTNTVAPKTVTEKNSKTRAQKRSAEIFSRAGRVEEERGGVQGRRRRVRAAPFGVALAEKPIAPFPLPGHRTGRDHFGHRLTPISSPLLVRAHPEPGPLSSAGIARLH